MILRQILNEFRSFLKKLPDGSLWVEYRKIHTRHTPPRPPADIFGPTIIRGGGAGCWKRRGNVIIFLPPKIHSRDFIPIFSTTFSWYYCRIYRWGGVLKSDGPKILDSVFNWGGGLCHDPPPPVLALNILFLPKFLRFWSNFKEHLN